MIIGVKYRHGHIHPAKGVKPESLLGRTLAEDLLGRFVHGLLEGSHASEGVGGQSGETIPSRLECRVEALVLDHPSRNGGVAICLGLRATAVEGESDRNVIGGPRRPRLLEAEPASRAVIGENRVRNLSQGGVWVEHLVIQLSEVGVDAIQTTGAGFQGVGRYPIARVALLVVLLESITVEEPKPGLPELCRNPFVGGIPSGVHVREDKVEVPT